MPCVCLCGKVGKAGRGERTNSRPEATSTPRYRAWRERASGRRERRGIAIERRRISMIDELTSSDDDDDDE